VRILLTIAVALATSWAVLVAVLFLARPQGVDFAEAKRFVPDLVALVRELRRDPAVGGGVRLRLWLLLAYLALPFDLVPDFIPVLGYADDVIVVLITLRSVIRLVGEAPLRKHWPGTPAGFEAVLRLTHSRSAEHDHR